jgi:hypothetical protein
MIRATFLIVAFALSAAAADDKGQWQPPSAPDGWKYVASSDGVYRFVAPKDTKRTSTRDRTMTINRVRARINAFLFVLKDDTVLKVESLALSGAALRGVKVSDVLDSILSEMKGEGFSASEPKEVTVGDVKANEYRLSKKGQDRRVVLFHAQGRVFVLEVASADPKALDTKTADTFLKSLVLVPADVLRAEAKERAAQLAARVEQQKEKYGFGWTTDPAAMTPPDAPVVGELRGVEFKPDVVKYEAGRLWLRQGKEVFADGEVSIVLTLKPGESLEKREYSFTPAKGGDPAISLSTHAKTDKLPKLESFNDKYALKLTFGEKDKDGKIPGTIYLSLPDAARSFVAGKFSVTIK